MQRLHVEIPQWLRSLPVLSLGIAATWLLVSIGVQLGYASRLAEADKELRIAAQFAIRDPLVKVAPGDLWLVRAVKPDFENDTVLEFMRGNEAQGARTSQQRFEGLATSARTALAGHPFRVLGLVPSRPSPPAFASHFFVHAGVVHLGLVTLCFLLVAPTLERRWGATALAGVLAVSVLISALAFCLVHSDGHRALVGGAAGVSALVAAFVVRFKDEPIDFLAPFSGLFEAELTAPAFSLGVLWLCTELAFWWVVPSGLPRGVDNAAGYTAHVASAAVGALAPLAFARLGLTAAASDEAAGATRSEPRKTKKKGRAFDIQKVVAMRAGDDEDGAFALLQTEVQRSARNRDAVTMYWQMAVERGVADEAAPFMAQLLDEELRRGAEAVAVGLWHELSKHSPKAPLDPARLVKLAPAIGRVEGKESVLRALRQTQTPENKHALTATVAAEVARMALEIDARLAAAAARRAIDSFDLEHNEQQELEMLAQALAPSEDRRPKQPSPSSVLYDETDRSAFGEVSDLSELDAGFPDGSITEAVPRAAQKDGLRLVATGDQEIELAYAVLRAVSVVGVKGLGPKPVLLLDLVAGGGGEGPLGVIRVRCDHFDPRSLVPSAKGPLDALRTLVTGLLSRSEAALLPDPADAQLGAVRTFDSLDAYHEQVLRPAGRKLG